ncbi:MAG: tetratricopeptide repeat protein [Cyclobacteriaceae bacterium]|nr:tetratricopeptide repeat protein [Cyclobacteriaceae bacterium]
MEQPQEPSGQAKLYRALTLTSALLLAIFWSLGTFFFWSLLGLTASFAVLWFFASGADIFKNVEWPSFSGGSRKRPRDVYGRPAPNPAPVRNMLRTFIILFGLMFGFFFLVGLFSDDEEETPVTVEGEAPVEQVQATEDPAAAVWNEKGATAYNNNSYDSADYYFNKALQIDPKDMYALYNRGLVFSARKQYRRAIESTRYCLRLYPDYNYAWWLLGDTYNYMNNYDSALYCLEHIYDKGFGELDFLTLLGQVYQNRRNTENAVAIYQEILQQDSSRVEAYEQLAKLDPEKSDWYRTKKKVWSQPK